MTRAESTGVLDELSNGRLGDDWKDVALVLPGERLRVGQRLTRYPALFLYHCHDEDQGRLRNFCVEA